MPFFMALVIVVVKFIMVVCRKKVSTLVTATMAARQVYSNNNLPGKAAPSNSRNSFRMARGPRMPPLRRDSDQDQLRSNNTKSYAVGTPPITTEIDIVLPIRRYIQHTARRYFFHLIGVTALVGTDGSGVDLHPQLIGNL